MSHRRFEYSIELKVSADPVTPGPVVKAAWRNPSISDQQRLAELMLDAYRDTIDYDGETLEDAMREVASYFASQDVSWLDNSWLAFIENDLACACLVGFWEEKNSPIISYVMTAPQWKGKYLALSAVSRSLRSLVEKNYDKAYAVITEGNVPSERVFARLGFKRLIPTD